jgi:hypothetical protein
MTSYQGIDRDGMGTSESEESKLILGYSGDIQAHPGK